MSLAFTSTFARALPLRNAALSPLRGAFRPVWSVSTRRARSPARWQATAASAAADAQAAINSSNVMVFSTSYCPYCTRVQALFTELEVPHTVWELDLRRDGGDIRAFLMDTTGQRTVPNVFIGGKHVGGCDDTMELYQQGKLLDMINSATV